jgi:hypothetical protein
MAYQYAVGIGLLDQPLPPTNRTPRIPLGRIIAAVILILIAIAALLAIVPHH